MSFGSKPKLYSERKAASGAPSETISFATYGQVICTGCTSPTITVNGFTVQLPDDGEMIFPYVPGGVYEVTNFDVGAGVIVYMFMA